MPDNDSVSPDSQAVFELLLDDVGVSSHRQALLQGRRSTSKESCGVHLKNVDQWSKEIGSPPSSPAAHTDFVSLQANLDRE